MAKDLVYGSSARALALNTAISKREEEFPMFTKFWAPAAERFGKRMNIYALLEGPVQPARIISPLSRASKCKCM